MPIYEFRCSECGCEFETLVMKRDEKISCSKCGSARVDRLFSSFAVHGAESKALPGCGPDNKCSSCATRKCSTCCH